MKDLENTKKEEKDVKEELENRRHKDGSWSLKDIVDILGLTYDKVKKGPLRKAQDILSAQGLRDHDHFGYEKKGKAEDYKLTLAACKMLTTVALVNDSKKDDRVRLGFQYFDGLKDEHQLLQHDKNEINLKYWEKYNEESSKRYKKEMQRLDSLSDFTRDNSYHGIYAPHHIMYKLNTLESKDKKRKYEFLIEYDINEPTVGIYYGCKGLINENANNDEQIEILNKEWKELRGYVGNVLSNIYPGKNFNLRFKATNNANDRTYWPFWISLYEEEDIIEVAAKATMTIQRIYQNYLGLIDDSLKSQSIGTDDWKTFKELVSQSGESEERSSVTELAFTNQSYEALLGQIRKTSEKQTQETYDRNKYLFEKFIEVMTKTRRLYRDVSYEKAWMLVDIKVTNFYYFVDALFQYINREEIYLKQDLSKRSRDEKQKWITVPWSCVERVFLNKEGCNFNGNLKKEYNKNNSNKARMEARDFLFGQDGILAKHIGSE